ncbi:hypothetical protein FQN49_003821 [Arthroderma sp. PD_2]|nr:hypothetical protein FQN49_003821 [Arthroderma sp. PD_2]
MEADFPPLPLATAKRATNGTPAPSSPSVAISTTGTPILTICKDGDVVVVCDCSSHNSLSRHKYYLVRLRSLAITSSSDYFKALLDPDKFQEGRSLLESHTQLKSQHGSLVMALEKVGLDQLVQIKLKLPPLSTKANLKETLTLYFEILCLTWEENSSDTYSVLTRLANCSVSVLASLVVISDRFVSHPALKRAFRLAKTSEIANVIAPMKIIQRLWNFDNDDEERIREAIYLAYFFKERKAVNRLTHTLILRGSVNWAADKPDGHAGLEKPLWWHLSEGIEEELQFRHDSILDTISEIQNYFLTAYGAVNPYQSPQPSRSRLSLAPKRQLQCRRVLANSRACDSFQLGEMIHFFTSLSKTLYLESAIFSESDTGAYGDGNASADGESVDYVPDISHEYQDINGTHYKKSSQLSIPNQAATMANIGTIISCLRQCPEYQIDSYHLGCGLRRRLTPLLDYICKFTTMRGSVGLCLEHNVFGMAGRDSWRNNQFRDKAHVLASAHTAVSVTYSGNGSSSANLESAANPRAISWCDCIPKSMEARGFFTARKRRWEC